MKNIQNIFFHEICLSLSNFNRALLPKTVVDRVCYVHLIVDQVLCGVYMI